MECDVSMLGLFLRWWKALRCCWSAGLEQSAVSLTTRHAESLWDYDTDSRVRKVRAPDSDSDCGTENNLDSDSDSRTYCVT